MIFEHLEGAIKEEKLDSFFVPGYNLLSEPMYRNDFRLLLYVWVCKAMLSDPTAAHSAWDDLVDNCQDHLSAARVQEEEDT